MIRRNTDIADDPYGGYDIDHYNYYRDTNSGCLVYTVAIYTSLKNTFATAALSAVEGKGASKFSLTMALVRCISLRLFAIAKDR